MTGKFMLMLFFLGVLVSACGAVPEPTGQPFAESPSLPANAQATDVQPGLLPATTEDVDSEDFADSGPVSVSESDEIVAVISTRQIPEDFDWRQAPIIPEISDTVLEIFQNGIAQGRDLTHFSVVGDCQAIPFVFMGPIGRKELLPGGNEQYLWDSVRYFDPSLNRESI
ncbi:MAG: hypothetical protein R6W69_16965, partial [Anaerolineales bacterium]